VDVAVLPAGFFFGVAALLRYGPSGDRWHGGQVLLLLSVFVLLGISGGLAVLALGR